MTTMRWLATGVAFAPWLALSAAAAQDVGTSLHDSYSNNRGAVMRGHMNALQAKRAAGRSAETARPPASIAECSRRAAARGYTAGRKYRNYVDACLRYR